MNITMTDPNYWVAPSITGDGSYSVVSDRDGGVVEGFDTAAEADARCAALNAEDTPTTYFVSNMDGKSVVESPSGRIVCVATTRGEARKIAAALTAAA